VQAILTHCPNPYDVLAFSVEDMVEFLRDYLGRGGEKTARKVLRNVRQALLPPEPIAHILAPRVQEEWQAFQHCLTSPNSLLRIPTSRNGLLLCDKHLLFELLTPLGTETGTRNDHHVGVMQ
jgi:hypothetical protein